MPYILLILLSFPAWKMPVHEFHVSKCLIEYSEPDEALQITMHLFIDDLEEALRQRGVDKLFICTEKEHEDAEKYMLRYLQQEFQLVVEGDTMAYHFIGKEVSEDLIAVWCYMEVENVPAVKELEVTNRVLTEVFDDQKNVVSVIGPNRKKEYFLLNRLKNRKTLTF